MTIVHPTFVTGGMSEAARGANAPHPVPRSRRRTSPMRCSTGRARSRSGAGGPDRQTLLDGQPAGSGPLRETHAPAIAIRKRCGMTEFINVLAATGDVDAIRISFNENSDGDPAGGHRPDHVRHRAGHHHRRLPAGRPSALAISIAIAAQFILLPFITFCLTLILGVRGSVALGMILVACCPPGNVSNIVTHLSGATSLCRCR